MNGFIIDIKTQVVDNNNNSINLIYTFYLAKEPKLIKLILQEKNI